jgi:hypothetical protein
MDLLYATITSDDVTEASKEEAQQLVEKLQTSTPAGEK